MLAVYTLVVDRLEYTQRTIKNLEDQDIEFDHYILSQGSNEETNQWLSTYGFKNKVYLYTWDENKGISHGSNYLLDEIEKRKEQFDLICKIDNDVETVTPNWLPRCAAVASKFNILCSPLVVGLKSFSNGVPGYTTQEMEGERIRLTPHIGGIVHMAKASLHFDYRYDPELCMAVDQDVSFTHYARATKYWLVGYLEDVKVEHMDTTLGQEEKYPEYFEEKNKVWHRESYKAS